MRDYANSRQNNLELYFVAIPVDWILPWYDSGTDGRAYGHVITKISCIPRWVDYPIFLGMERRSHVELRYKIGGIIFAMIIDYLI